MALQLTLFILIIVKADGLDRFLTGQRGHQGGLVNCQVCYLARLGVCTDGTWLQLMCCTYADVLSLYFGQTDGPRFRQKRGEGVD